MRWRDLDMNNKNNTKKFFVKNEKQKQCLIAKSAYVDYIIFNVRT